MVAGFLVDAVGAAGPDGLARTPPLGWRSWNAFGRAINQSRMEEVMDAVAARERVANGAPTSLLDLGYVDIGLDDNWQACGAGNLSAFHDTDGLPVVNLARVNMAACTRLAGWLASGC